jgi:3-oxoacyl-[acyl-carrier-protein] synthase II
MPEGLEVLNRPKAVITGVSVLAPNGIGKDAFWKTLIEGKSGIGLVTLFDASDLPCRTAGEVKGFDPSLYVNNGLKPRRMGRFAQLGVAAATMAFEDAKIDLKHLRNGFTLPIVLGVSTSAMDLFARPPMFYTGPSSIPHAAGSAIGVVLGVHTRLITMSSACASSIDAIETAAAIVRRGQADLVLAGGTESSITHYVFKGIGQSGMLGSRNGEPEKASRPFDRERNGGIIAEGAGMVVVENADSAAARSVEPYAEILGYGNGSDEPDAEEASGLEGAMRLALANAGRRPDEIDHINAHGPSDKHLDWMETVKIKEVFGKRAYRMPVVSIKGATGNPFGAAGALQVVASCLSLQRRIIPPTTNYEHPDPDCDLDYVPGRPRPAEIRTVLVNSHGVGHVNSSLVLERVAGT